MPDKRKRKWRGIKMQKMENAKNIDDMIESLMTVDDRVYRLECKLACNPDIDDAQRLIIDARIAEYMSLIDIYDNMIDMMKDIYEIELRTGGI
jgi:hypothetical protein